MAATPTSRRNYGTGTLKVVGKSWVAWWYAPNGKRVCRKVGPARTPGEKDGLTKAQAEQAFRKMRETEHAREAPGPFGSRWRRPARTSAAASRSRTARSPTA